MADYPLRICGGPPSLITPIHIIDDEDDERDVDENDRANGEDTSGSDSSSLKDLVVNVSVLEKDGPLLNKAKRATIWL